MRTGDNSICWKICKECYIDGFCCKVCKKNTIGGSPEEYGLKNSKEICKECQQNVLNKYK